MLVDKFSDCDKIKEQIKKRNFVMKLTAEHLIIATEGCETVFQSASSDQEAYKEKHKSLMNRVDNNLKEINNKLEQIKALLK